MSESANIKRGFGIPRQIVLAATEGASEGAAVDVAGSGVGGVVDGGAGAAWSALCARGRRKPA
jgi:hypothetical protein